MIKNIMDLYTYLTVDVSITAFQEGIDHTIVTQSSGHGQWSGTIGIPGIDIGTSINQKLSSNATVTGYMYINI